MYPNNPPPNHRGPILALVDYENDRLCNAPSPPTFPPFPPINFNSQPTTHPNPPLLPRIFVTPPPPPRPPSAAHSHSAACASHTTCSATGTTTCRPCFGHVTSHSIGCPRTREREGRVCRARWFTCMAVSSIAQTRGWHLLPNPNRSARVLMIMPPRTPTRCTSPCLLKVLIP
jgi:hypothetical protein